MTIRALLLLASLFACGSAEPGEGPTPDAGRADGASGSDDCTAVDGVSDGASCAGAPVSSCYYEGVADCETPPTSAGCSCDADGTWHCFCSCYGPSSTCPLATGAGGCPLSYRPEIEGSLCELGMAPCSYPGQECTCEEEVLGEGALSCHPTDG